MPPFSQSSAPAYRIYQGDTILGVGWSNVAANMDGFFRVVYDDGEPDTIRWDRTVATSARAAFLVTSAQVARKDGYVTQGAIFGDAPQRGQTYLVAYIGQGYQPGDVRSVLAKGYVYQSVPLQVGQQVEPGPAGGHGAFTLVSLPNPAAGAEYANVVLPTGACWRVRGIEAPVVNAAAAASRLFTARVADAVGGHGLILVATGVTLTGETHTYRGMNGGPPSGVPAAMTGFADVPVAVSDRILMANSASQPTIIFTTDNLNAGDDYGAGFLGVEEWVMPN